MTDLDRYLTDEVAEKAARAEWEHEWPARSWGRAPMDIQDFYVSVVRAALSAVLPDIIRQAKAEAWEEGAHTAWERSTPVVNGASFYWRHEGEPVNPYGADRIEQGGQP